MWFSTTVFHIILCTIHLISCLENINAESETALEATIGQFPYQAYIQVKTSGKRTDVQYTLCSGSIISERWILTTANCVMEAKESPMDVDVTVGIILRDEQPVDGTFKAQDICIHDEFDKKTIQNNLALIYLDNDMVFSDNASSIEIPNTDYFAVDGTVTAWALNKVPNETLLYSKATIISDEDCEKFFTAPCRNVTTYNKTTNFCTVRPPSQEDGSPFAVKDGVKHFQIGIISSDTKCNDTYISLYLDVSQYSDWITSTQASKVTTTTTLNADTTETAVQTSTSTVTTALTTVASSLSGATSTLTVDTTTLSTSLNTEDTSESIDSTTFTTQNSDTTTPIPNTTIATTITTSTSSVMTSESPTTLNVDSSSLTSDYNSQQTSTPFTSSNAVTTTPATTTTVTTIHTSSTVKPSTTPQKPVITSPTHTTTTTSTRRPFINFTTPSNSKRITLKHHLVLILAACTLIIMHINFKSLF